MATKRWFRFAFHESGRAGRELPLHHLRDADAALCLASVLRDRGFVYGGILLNVPLSGQTVPPAMVFDVNDQTPALGTDDLLLMTTRPPLNDVEEGNRSQVDCSYNSLEARILGPLRTHLPWCSRMRVKLSVDLAARSDLARRYANVEFGDGRSAPIQRYQPNGIGKWTQERDRRKTLAYQLYLPSLWAGGPGLLAAFGMGGLQTLAWSYRLGTDLRDMVMSEDFLLAEMVQEDAPGRPVTLDFTNAWTIRT